VTAETRQLLVALGDAPAVVTGRRGDVLAWNRTGHALFAGYLDPAAPDDVATRPNLVRSVFADAPARELYCDWNSKARAVVGNLRLMMGRHPDDPMLASLIGELTIQSREFAALWADHRVRDCDVAVFTMHQPLVGELTVAQQTLPVPLAPEQRLVVATAEASSASAASLLLLAQAVAAPSAGHVPSDRTPVVTSGS